MGTSAPGVEAETGSIEMKSLDDENVGMNSKEEVAEAVNSMNNFWIRPNTH